MNGDTEETALELPTGEEVQNENEPYLSRRSNFQVFVYDGIAWLPLISVILNVGCASVFARGRSLASV